MFNSFGVHVRYYVDGFLMLESEKLAATSLSQVLSWIATDSLWAYECEELHDKGCRLEEWVDGQGYEGVTISGKKSLIVCTVSGYCGERDTQIYLGTLTLQLLPGAAVWTSRPVIGDV